MNHSFFRSLCFIVLGSAGMWFTACGGSDPVPPQAIIRLNGEWIYWENFESVVEEVHGESVAGLADRVLTAMLDQYLDEKHLEIWSADQKISVGSNGLLQSILDHEMRLVNISTDEVETYYRQHLSDFQQPERLHLRQIVVSDRVALGKVQERLNAGDPFEAVAEQFDVAGGLGPGGDQGILRRDQLPDIFEEAVMSLETGEVSEPQSAPHGYHFFQVIRRLPSETLALEQVETQIRHRLLGSKADILLENIIEEARQTWPVEVIASNLPFQYTGLYQTSE